MAVTRTRTRTQTALTTLAKHVAEVHGELQVLGQLLAAEDDEAVKARLEARRLQLEADRDALYVTLRQFDPELVPEGVGVSFGWLMKYGKGKAAMRRYASAFTLLDGPSRNLVGNV